MNTNTATKSESTDTARPPVQNLRDGLLNIAVWERVSSEGNAFYNVTFERRYNKDGKWASTQSLGEGDLLSMAELLRQAYQEIKKLRSPARDAE